MNCLKYDKKGKRLVPDKIPIPKVEEPWEVVIKVATSGLCGTDLHVLENKYEAIDGVVLGHEFCGTVHEVGKSTNLKVGERVAVNPNRVCGVCFFCKRGQVNYCEKVGIKGTLGIAVNGGFAEYCKCHFSMVFKLPSALTFDQAVLSEPLSCITHGLDILGPVEIGSKILIIGAGIVGLLFSSIFHYMGHKNTFMIEKADVRRQNFSKLQLGYDAMSWSEIDKCKDDCVDFDVVIDTSADPEAMVKAIKLLQVKGRLVIYGVADPIVTIEISPFDMYKRELNIMGSCINTNVSFTNAINLAVAMGDRYLNVEKLTMKPILLKEYEPAMEELRQRKCSKIVLKFQ